MIIRQATSDDCRPSELLTRSAFWNIYCPGCSEHYLLHLMRQQPDYLPELDIVAEAEGAIVGHCICCPSYIEGDDHQRHRVLTLGPIAVAPAYQRRGIGAALIDKVRSQAAELGYAALLLCGDPDYYLRRGFAPASRWDIRNAENKYFRTLMAMELQDGALASCGGRYIENKVYFSFCEADVEAFDAQFPLMQKESNTPEQLRFEALMAAAEEERGDN